MYLRTQTWSLGRYISVSAEMLTHTNQPDTHILRYMRFSAKTRYKIRYCRLLETVSEWCSCKRGRDLLLSDLCCSAHKMCTQWEYFPLYAPAGSQSWDFFSIYECVCKLRYIITMRLNPWGVRSAWIMCFTVNIIYSLFLLSTSSLSPFCVFDSYTSSWWGESYCVRLFVKWLIVASRSFDILSVLIAVSCLWQL